MLTDAEQGFIDAVKASPLEPRLRTIESVPEINADVVKKMVLSAPAVYVTVRDWSINGDLCEVTLDVISISKNLRGREAARRGDSTVIGVYDICDALAAMCGLGSINGYNLTKGRLDRAQWWAAAGAQAAVQEATTRLTLPGEFDPATLADFTDWHADHYEPGGIAAGDNPIATDEVTA